MELGKDYLIVDNFYIKPELVREFAISRNYESVVHLNYPGDQSEFSFYSRELIAKIEENLNLKIKFDQGLNSFGKFRLMTKDSGSRLKVHVDGKNEWTGLIYLNLPSQCEGGTSFYMHKETRICSPLDTARIKAYGADNYLDFEKKYLLKDTLDLTKWEEILHVEMKFNRLVLFKGGEFFHCHTHSFGTDINNGRLTQNFFFDVDLNYCEALCE